MTFLLITNVHYTNDVLIGFLIGYTYAKTVFELRHNVQIMVYEIITKVYSWVTKNTLHNFKTVDDSSLQTIRSESVEEQDFNDN